MSKIKNHISKIAAVALVAQYIDSNGTCYDITIQHNISNISQTFFDSFYQTKLPSFQSFQTGKITLSSVMLDFANYHQTKQFLI